MATLVLVAVFSGFFTLIAVYFAALRPRAKALAEAHLAAEVVRSEITELKIRASGLQAQLESLASEREAAKLSGERREAELARRLEGLSREKLELSSELANFKAAEEARLEIYSDRLANVNSLIETSEKERARIEREKNLAEELKAQALRETWARHERDVEEKMKLACQKFGIQYVDKEKFPFKGKPDNAVLVCEEYVVFDSKSPRGEDLANFPSYIRAQADEAKKYAKYEGVRKDIFLVVPISAVSVVNETHLPRGDYRVHVITPEAIAPILLQLQRIEDYEFAEQLSPEDREEIVVSIGKMAHLLKRRLQVDYFFASESVKVLADAENLPADILEKARKVEQSSVLNPKREERAKRIEMSMIRSETEKLAAKVGAEGINTGVEVMAINEVPLYKRDE